MAVLAGALGGGVPVSTTFIAAGGWLVCKCTPLQIARLPAAGLDPFRGCYHLADIGPTVGGCETARNVSNENDSSVAGLPAVPAKTGSG
jgi:hypothetical protein